MSSALMMTRSITVDTSIQSQLARLAAADPEPGDDRRANLTDALDSTPAALYCCRRMRTTPILSAGAMCCAARI